MGVQDLLPTLPTLCGFLSLRDTLCSLAHCCHSLNRHIGIACLKQPHIHANITKNTASFLHPHRAAALHGCVSSLSILTVPQEDEAMEMEVMVLQLYWSPAFLFSSITSLYLARAGLSPFPNQSCWHRTLNGFLDFVSSRPDALPSLRRLHIAGCTLWKNAGDEVNWSALSHLQRLTHLRIEPQMDRAFCTNNALLTAVCSLPSLQSVDLAGIWLPVDAAVSFMAQLRSSICRSTLRYLWLPQVGWRHIRVPAEVDFVYVGTALCELLGQGSSPAEVSRYPLEYVGCCDGLSLSSELLQSFFSLQHTRVINLIHCTMQPSQFAAFCTVMAQLPRLPPLVTLHLPAIRGDTRTRLSDHLQIINTHLPQLLSRLSTIRDLGFEWVGLDLDLPSIVEANIRNSINRLILKAAAAASAMQLHRPALRDLTELTLLPSSTNCWLVHDRVVLLLTSLPKLRCLTLKGWEWESWEVVSIIARCCPQLLQLIVGGKSRGRPALDSVTVPPRPFLPQLLALDMCDAAEHLHQAPYDFAHLQLFLQPPSAALHSVTLTGSQLTAQHVLQLGCLPALQQLCAPLTRENRYFGQPCETIPELRIARRLTERRLGLPVVELLEDTRENCEGGMSPPPRTPSDLEIIRRNLLRQKRISSTDNLLSCGPDVVVREVRSVFFQELEGLLRDGSVRDAPRKCRCDCSCNCQ